MNFKNWIRVSESVKNNELNRILDKISNGGTLTELEGRFLDRFGISTDDDFKEFSYLSRNDVFEKIQKILSEDKEIICDLYDRDGQIGIIIESVYNNFETEKCYMILKNSETVELKDNFLYNILYIIKKNQYSLQSQDEYYERIPVKDEN